jgi:predicted  nucleic acid-binding Zn-ribbon protein
VTRPDAIIDVQRLDTEADQLRHRRASLPQREALDSALAERDEHQKTIDVIAAQRVEVATRQKRLEDEAAIVAARADQDDSRLYSGEVQGLKDLEALQEEIAGLRARQGDLEEQAIEAMVEADELSVLIEEREAGRPSIDERVTVLSAELEAAESELDAELTRVVTERAAAADDADPDVLARYERLHPTFGSATAVRFDDKSGCGCPSSMPAVEFDRVKRCDPGSILECEECGRIVVR